MSAVNEFLTIINLCGRLNLTEAETRDLIKKVRDGNMGYLFENMEKMDIQLERRNTAEQRARAEEAEQKMHSICRMLISSYQQQNLDKESIKQQLISELQMKESEADELIEMF